MTLPQKIYPVVSSAAWVGRLGKAGARFIQLRIKDLSPDELLSEIRQARDLAEAYNVTLVLNDYWQEAISEGLNWIHLGQEDLDTADIKAIRTSGIHIGISTHSHPELDRALSLNPDYVALGPIWPTTLKKMIWSPQGTDRLTEWKKAIHDIPLVAIGGITKARVQACLSAGADCVAAVSDFTQNTNPERQIQDWLAVAGT